MNFRIIENTTDEQLYNNFKKDFIDTSYTALDLMKKYSLGRTKYNSLRDMVCDELGLKGKPKKEKSRANIVRNLDDWVIRKKINGKRVFFGSYKDLEIAIKVRDELIKCNWDKNLYPEIRNIIVLESKFG